MDDSMILEHHDDAPVFALTQEGARAVATHPGLKGSDWRLLFYVIGHIGERNHVRPFATAEACEELGITRQTLYASLKRLRTAGVLYTEHSWEFDRLNEDIGISAERIYYDEPFPDMG